MITAPYPDRRAHCSSVRVERGVSRMQRISGNRSFRQTWAVRVISVSPMPEAIFPTVDVDAGRMTHASRTFDPEAMGAVRSSSE